MRKESKFIIRLGHAKVKFLVKGIGQLRPGRKVLEIFGGSNLSTAVIAKVVGGKNLVSLDLRYHIGQKGGWRYDVSANYIKASELLNLSGASKPRFVAADAELLPFQDGSFGAVVAPDPPRLLTSIRENSSQEVGGFKQLFLRTAEEALRVLEEDGLFIATAPLSWARAIHEMDFRKIQIFSSEPLGEDVTLIRVGQKLQFKTYDVADPIVYLRCVK